MLFQLTRGMNLLIEYRGKFWNVYKLSSKDLELDGKCYDRGLTEGRNTKVGNSFNISFLSLGSEVQSPVLKIRNLQFNSVQTQQTSSPSLSQVSTVPVFGRLFVCGGPPVLTLLLSLSDAQVPDTVEFNLNQNMVDKRFPLLIFLPICLWRKLVELRRYLTQIINYLISKQPIPAHV